MALLVRKLAAIPRTCSRCCVEFMSVNRGFLCGLCAQPKQLKPPVDKNYLYGLPLSDRELHLVWRLATQAPKNKELAHDLHLTEGTIKAYLNTIFHKTGARNRTGLLIWVMQNRDKVFPADPAVLRQ